MRVAVVLALLCRLAIADPTDPFTSAHGTNEDATRLFEEARELTKQGKLGQACEVFERSYRIERAIGTELNLADCKEHSGKLREAWEMFVAAAMHAVELGDKVRSQFARNRAAALVGKLAEVVVVLDPPIVPNAVISIGGRIVPTAPTIHEYVEAGVVAVREASGDRFLEKTVIASAGENVKVELGTLAPPPPTHRRRSWLYGSAGLVVAGVASFYGGTLFSGAADDNAQVIANSSCMPTTGGKYVCPTPAAAAAIQGTIDALDRDHNLATVFEIGGVVMVAGAVAVVLFAPKDQIVVVPTATSNSVGMAFSARF